jgi:replicative DNA helicase
MIDLMVEASELLNDEDDPMKVLRTMHGELVGLQSDVDGTGSETDLVKDWQHTFEDVLDRVKRTQSTGLAGIPTGFTTLDNMTGGPQPGEYWVVAARLGQGKTWTLIRMACAALYAGHRVQYDALEQSRNQIALRVHTFLSGKYGTEVFKAVDLMMGKNIDLPKYRKFLRDLDQQMKGSLIINDTSRGKVNPLTIASQIERNSPEIVYIDYITLMGGVGGDSKSREQWQQVASLSAEMKGLAMRYKVPIVVAAQINRMGLGGRMPGVEHLSGSDAIGHDADAVVTMRKESDHVMRLKLAKYRHGRDGFEWYSEFQPNTGHYEEVSRERAEEIMEDDAQTEDDE